METDVVDFTWMPTDAVNCVQAGQSSWSKGSSIETTEEKKEESARNHGKENLECLNAPG